MSQRTHGQEPAGTRRSTWIDIPQTRVTPAEASARRSSKHVEPPPVTEGGSPNPASPDTDWPRMKPAGDSGDPIWPANRRCPRLRSFVVGASALASVAGLIAATVLPATSSAIADSTAAASRQQAFVTGGTTDDPGVLPPASISAVEVPVAEADVLNANATELTDTKLKYPFDQEVPLTDGFGYRVAPVEGFHDAQDMAAAGGTSIRIIGDGVVSAAGWASDGCGFALTVQHQVGGQNVASRYCHMQESSHSWQVGQTVKAGDQAGLVGTTGMSFGNHLHLVVRVEDEPVDPLPFIAKNSK